MFTSPSVSQFLLRDDGSYLFPKRNTVSKGLLLGGTTAATADIVLGADGSLVVNEQGNAVTIRFEGDTVENLFYIDGANNAVGFNTNDPTFIREGSAKPSPFLSLKTDSANGNAGAFAIASDTSSRAADVSFLRSRGTWASKATVLNNDVIANVGFEGHDGTDFNRSAYIQVVVDGTAGANQIPMEMLFLTSSTNGGGAANRLRLRANGIVQFGGSRTTPNVTIDTTTGSTVFNEQAASASWRLEGSSDEYLIYTNGSDDVISMGTPTTALTINGFTVRPKLLVDRSGGDTSINFITLSNSDTATAGAFMVGARARGLLTSLTTYQAVQDGDRCLVFRNDTHDGTQFITSGDFSWTVAGAVSTGIVPTKFSITVTDTSGTRDDAFIILSDGQIQFQDVATGNVQNRFFPDGGATFNEQGNGTAQSDVRAESVSYINMFRIDASANRVDIGTATQGVITSFRDSIVWLNNTNLDIDFRWDGDTNDYGIMGDAANEKVGIFAGATPHSTVHSGGSLAAKTTTVTSTTYTALATDFTILVDDDTAGAAVTVTLPAASGCSGRIYNIKKLGTTGNVTVDGNASETIDGSTTQVITTQYVSITIQSDGTSWHII